VTGDARVGKRIGSGGTSDVHDWGDGLVVKVFKPRFEHLAPMEAERASAVHAAGVPCPAVHDLITVDDRPGLVFDKLEGPWALGWPDGAAITARVHAAIHDIEAPEALPRLVDRLADLGVHGLPDGDRIFHGDLHPLNVLADGDGWSVIDWSGAHRGARAADVAMSVLAMGYRGLQDGPKAMERHQSRIRAAESYLRHYTMLRPGSLDELRRWTTAIGTLLLDVEPETAFADDLRRRWIDP
jgi:tRNA A-37 threonylcarbamoyl transferase component Bud32